MRSAGVRHETSSWYEQLEALYSHPDRHYHNFRHITDCLSEFDSVRDFSHQPVPVEFAIWFHDAIYDPRALDNEERSATLAKQCIAETCRNARLGESVAQLVLATKLHDGSLHFDAPLLVDIDLSILGQPADRFWEYETQIRREYEWVPKKVFSEKRAEILQRFLSRKTIYNSEHFVEKYERQARLNLMASLQKLRRG
jgi:predicted metal-dependent HD superfamily phosphohydrolase